MYLLSSDITGMNKMINKCSNSTSDKYHKENKLELCTSITGSIR